MRIDVVVYDGFDELDVVGPYEVFTTAEALGGDVTVRLVTLAPADFVSGSHGLDMHTHGVLDGSADLVVVPGGGWIDRAERGAWAEVQRGDLPRAFAGLLPGTQLAAVCTGAMLLSAAGLLRGRPATTHRGAQDDLAAAGAVLIDARVVDDGDIVTSGGVTAGLDLALWLVERELGSELADLVAAELEYPHRRRATLRVISGGPRWRGDEVSSMIALSDAGVNQCYVPVEAISRGLLK